MSLFVSECVQDTLLELHGVKDVFHKICALLYKRFQPTETKVIKEEQSGCSV